MIVRRIIVVPLVLCLLLLSGVAALAHWTAGSLAGGHGAAAATTVGQGSTPSASALGRTVTVTWPASTLAGGQAVDGYQIKRYDSVTLVSQTITSACAGTVTATTCAESNVPEGSWVYTVTPRFATNWVGAESAKSPAVAVAVAPTVTINQAAAQADPTNGVADPLHGGLQRGGDRLRHRRRDPRRHRGRHHGRTVTGTGTTYDVAVSRHDGQRHRHRHHRRRRGVIDAAGNANTASTSTDNTVTYDTTGRRSRSTRRRPGRSRRTAIADQLHGGVQRGGGRLRHRRRHVRRHRGRHQGRLRDGRRHHLRRGGQRHDHQRHGHRQPSPLGVATDAAGNTNTVPRPAPTTR